MPDGTGPGGEVILHTARLRLRTPRVADAALQRALWLERDERVPPHRRVDADGHPTIEEFEERIRAAGPSSTELLVVELAEDGAGLGYCGLIPSGRGDHEPELAYELLRHAWGRGYATEASWAVLDWARSRAHTRLWADVWDWNTASLRVLSKLGFTEAARERAAYGVNLALTRAL